jgi:hypothetical protein
MPRTDHNQTWDRDGNLIHEEIVEVPDAAMTPDERIAELESKLAAIADAASFAQAQAALRARAGQ